MFGRREQGPLFLQTQLLPNPSGDHQNLGGGDLGGLAGRGGGSLKGLLGSWG